MSSHEPNLSTRQKLAYIFCSASRVSPSIFVKFSNAEEAPFISCFTVTDIFQSTEYFLIISAKPELKLGQHLVDGRIVSVSTVVRFQCQLRWTLRVFTYKELMAFVWVPWLLVIQTENWSVIFDFQTHCWCYLAYAVGTFFTPTLV